MTDSALDSPASGVPDIRASTLPVGTVFFKRLSESALIPQYQTEGASGFDLAAAENRMVAPWETMVIKTGLAVAIPAGMEMQIRPRSGLSLKTGLRIANSPGTIDSDFRGEIGIILENRSSKLERITIGMRIAQGVIAPVFRTLITEVDQLIETVRGEGGFGHTGK